MMDGQSVDRDGMDTEGMGESDMHGGSTTTSPIEFVDSGNVFWHVTERDARSDPGARGARCLIFSSNHAVRRVWKYPRDWRTLSHASLDELGASL